MTTKLDRSVGQQLTAVVIAGDELAGSAIAALLVDAGVRLADAANPPAGSVALIVDPSDQTWDHVNRTGVRALVLVEGEQADAEVVGAVLRGACGFVDLGSSPEILLSALESVSRWGTALSPTHSRAVADALRQRGRGGETVSLTSRERQILRAIADGESVKQTARRLGVSPRTIDNTQRVMFLKLGVRNRAHAVSRAHELGLLDSEQS